MYLDSKVEYIFTLKHNIRRYSCRKKNFQIVSASSNLSKRYIFSCILMSLPF